MTGVNSQVLTMVVLIVAHHANLILIIYHWSKKIMIRSSWKVMPGMVELDNAGLHVHVVVCIVYCTMLFSGTKG